MTVYTITQTLAQPIVISSNETFTTFSAIPSFSEVAAQTTTSKNVAIKSGRMSWSGLMVWLFMLFGVAVLNPIGNSACNVGGIGKRDLIDIDTHNITTSSGVIITTTTDDDALDYAEAMFVNGYSLSDVVFYANDTSIYIENITIDNETQLEWNSTTDLKKRWSCSSAPLGTQFTQRQTTQHGTWWTTWSKASACIDNVYNSASALYGINWSKASTKSINIGFSVGVAESDASLSFGYTLSETYTYGGTMTCNVNAGDKVSVWLQTLMYWSDQQTQSCNRHYYGTDGCKCGAWSGYIHGNVPVKNANANLGCSSGSSSGC